MNILNILKQLRDDIKEWVTNNLNALNAKIDEKTIPIDSELNSESTNPVQNQAITKEINSINNRVGNTPVATQISNAIDKVPTFSGDYNDLANAPNITEDESGNMVITDESGNIIFKADAEGMHTTSLTLNNENVNAILTEIKSSTSFLTPSTSEPDQLWFTGGSFTRSATNDSQDVNLGSGAYRWDKLFLSDGIDTNTKLITCSELDCLSGVTTNIQDAIDNLNTIGNQFTLYTNENRLAFNGNNFTPLNTSKMSNLGDSYNYWNTLYLQGGIKTPYAYIETRNLDQLANLSENVQNKLMLLTQGYNELAQKIENGTGGGSSSTTAPKVMSIFKPFDTAGSTLPYNVSYGQIGFDETSLTPWVYAPYTIYYVTWNGIYLNLNADGNTVDPTTMPTLLSRGYNYLVDDSTNSVYSVFSPGSASNTMPNTGTTPNTGTDTGTMPNTGTVGTISTGDELSGDLSLYYDTTSTSRWYPTSGWDTSFLQPSVTYKLCIMEWQPFLQPAESSLF